MIISLTVIRGASYFLRTNFNRSTLKLSSITGTPASVKKIFSHFSFNLPQKTPTLQPFEKKFVKNRFLVEKSHFLQIIFRTFFSKVRPERRRRPQAGARGRSENSPSRHCFNSFDSLGGYIFTCCTW